jgi:hypothetical protein
MGGQDGLSAFRKHPGRKAINAKRVAAPPGFTSSRLRSATTIFAVQSSIRPLEEHEHLRPGFRNHTHSPRKARMLYRADPFSDEDLEAGAGSRYDCFFCSIHQLASAR